MMQFHEIISVSATNEPDVYLALVDITDNDDERSEVGYVSRPGDTFGLAPQVRTAVLQWIADGKTVEPYVLPPLEETKAELKARLDRAAEAERLKYITPGNGQAMTYQQKAAEASACLADPAPDPASYPLLAAEIGITGASLIDVATVINGQYQAWQIIGAAIEAARLGGKKAVAEAETAEAAQLAFDAVVWPVLAI